ncbi:hypothetical protein AURDEDRAFT_147620 [Auricularia subglabra TFB-10046 SS5]|uniref:Uncharacterized protein n=1 Tax=Auricularia subglabra (strain TFB-10046 / SS5) TaxID=717982 RepID=J0WMB8_AURST|nr:hypothetical protein AURDEDRAFT_147620 [Auricularia subglabra TFB-10046 SS5]
MSAMGALTPLLLFACLFCIGLLSVAACASTVIRRFLSLAGFFIAAYLSLEAARTLQESACQLTFLATWIPCPVPIPEPPVSQASHQVSSANLDPVTVCNIFGGSTAPEESISRYMPSMVFTGNLAANISLWSPTSSEIMTTSESIKKTKPELGSTVANLSTLLGRSHGTYELAESTFSHWAGVVHQETSPGRLSATVYHALYYWWSPPIAQLPENLFNDLLASLDMLDRSIQDVRLSVHRHVEQVDGLHGAFSNASVLAWGEEWSLSMKAKRAWFPPSVDELSQESLRRQVRLHSIFAACALEYALGALGRISAALLALQELPTHMTSNSVTEVTITLQALRLRAAALKQANMDLQRMLM